MEEFETTSDVSGPNRKAISTVFFPCYFPQVYHSNYTLTPARYAWYAAMQAI